MTKTIYIDSVLSVGFHPLSSHLPSGLLPAFLRPCLSTENTKTIYINAVLSAVFSEYCCNSSSSPRSQQPFATPRMRRLYISTPFYWCILDWSHPRPSCPSARPRRHSKLQNRRRLYISTPFYRCFPPSFFLSPLLPAFQRLRPCLPTKNTKTICIDAVLSACFRRVLLQLQLFPALAAAICNPMNAKTVYIDAILFVHSRLVPPFTSIRAPSPSSQTAESTKTIYIDAVLSACFCRGLLQLQLFPHSQQPFATPRTRRLYLSAPFYWCILDWCHPRPYVHPRALAVISNC